MTPERWQQVKQLYNDALERKPGQRAAFLRGACAEDGELRREVESLLAEDETAQDFLESPALELAAKVFAQEQQPSLVGRQIGSYRVLSTLGAGGMGEVYRAKDTQLGRDVALKVLPRVFLRDPERLARFKKEALLLASLNHPNVITVYGIEQDDAIFAIAMELVEGKTLRELLAAGTLPVRNVLEVAVQMAAGLTRAHQARIVHRDLKPQNVMIRNDGLVKILDFGLGKLVPAPLEEKNPETPGVEGGTLPGRILGTVDYMSPQQAAGKAVDFRSDQFSFGSILYEMLTLKKAFHRETAAQTLTAIMEDEPEPVTALNPEVPFPLQEVIQRCLAKNPDNRYAATEELETELKELQANLSELRGATWTRFLPRHRPRWQVRLAGLLLAALLAAGVGLLAPSLPFRLTSTGQLQTLPEEKQIAVLSFTNVGNDPANQAFTDGLVETLSSKLSQLEQFQRALTVVPSSELRSEGITGAREARQIFGATLAISGSVQRTENRLRINISLVDTQTLRQLKARSMDTEIRDVSVLQDGVVLAVADLLEVDLPEQAKQVLAAGGTTAPGAYEFYTQGRGYLQRYEDGQNLDTAIGLFQRALEMDSNYALAHAGLGEAYWRKYEISKELQWAEQARASSAMALELNDQLAQVYVILGMIHTGTGRYEEAVRSVQRAIELDPLNPDAYRELAAAYEALQRMEEAEATYQKAIGARPGFWGSHNNLGRFYFRQGRYPEAEAQFRRIVELTPDNWRGYNGLGAVYGRQQRYDEAVGIYEKLVAIEPTITAVSNLGTTYFNLARYADAARAFERVIQMNDRDYTRWRNLASAYQWAPGEGAKARGALQRAAELAEQQRRLNPRSPNILMDLADCYSLLGQGARARNLLRQALAMAPQEVYLMFQAGVVYEQLGDRQNALQWISRAIQNGYSRDLIERAPDLAQLRADARFQQLNQP